VKLRSHALLYTTILVLGNSPLPPPAGLATVDLGDRYPGLHIATRQHLGDDRTVPTVAQGRVKKTIRPGTQVQFLL